MMDEAQGRAHRRNVFDAKVAVFPELGEDLNDIDAQFIESERTRPGVGHQAILGLVSPQRGQLLSLRQKPQLAEGQEPGFRQDVTCRVTPR
jgi:hypothetical protein